MRRTPPTPAAVSRLAEVFRETDAAIDNCAPEHLRALGYTNAQLERLAPAAAALAASRASVTLRSSRS